MSPARDAWLVRLYRRLTHLYPAPFRDDYGGEMVEMLRDRHADESGARERAHLWLSVFADLFRTAPQEHAHMLRQDLTHAFRVLRATPSLTIPVVLVLGLGIGATTAVFTLANAVLLRPLPFLEPDRLVLLDERAPSRNIPSMGTTFPTLRDYQAQSRSFDGIGAFFEGGFTLTGHGEPERVNGAWVSWNLFQVLGVAPARGRHFRPEEDQPNVETSVILGHGLWQRKYGGDPGIIGRDIQVGGRARTVVGVMPAGFRFPENGDIWAPLSLDPAKSTRTDNFLTTVARLKPGVSIAQASSEIQSIIADIRRRYPDVTGAEEVAVLSLRERLTGEYRPALIRLLGAVAFLLAIACTSVMNLLLARAARRRREFAIRTALGANRRRVIRQLLTEAFLLAAIGSAVGLLLGIQVVPAILNSAPVDIPYWIRVDTDVRVLSFVVLLMASTSVLFGLAPAIHSTRADLTNALKDGDRAGSAGPRAGRVRQVLVATQLALSVVLLVGAGLMIRSLANINAVDLGFTAQDALTFRLALPQVRYADGPQCAAFYRRMIDELAAVPLIRRVGAASSLPLEGGWWRGVAPEGATASGLRDAPVAMFAVATPGYFEAIGIRLLRGRGFAPADSNAAPAVILNETAARRLWGDRDPVGRRLKVDAFLPDEPWRTVVGVVSDVRARDPREPAPMAVYVPHASEPIGSMTIVIRSNASAPLLIGAARDVVRRIDPELPLSAIRTLGAVVDRINWTFRFYTQLFAVFAALAVLLSALALSGIMSHMVVERRHEIGIRVALGATRRSVMGLVFRRALLLVFIGLGAGTAAALLIARVLGALLFGVSGQDAVTFASVLAVLLAVGLVATLLPARAALRVSPLTVLRGE